MWRMHYFCFSLTNQSNLNLSYSLIVKILSIQWPTLVIFFRQPIYKIGISQLSKHVLLKMRVNSPLYVLDLLLFYGATVN